MVKVSFFLLHRPRSKAARSPKDDKLSGYNILKLLKNESHTAKCRVYGCVGGGTMAIIHHYVPVARQCVCVCLGLVCNSFHTGMFGHAGLLLPNSMQLSFA